MKFFFLIFFTNSLYADTCIEWFKKIKIKDDCEISCASADVDMSTYMCPDRCTDMCNLTQNMPEDLAFYGLTQSEVSICKSNKINCAKAYSDSMKAESYCLEIYPKSGLNDESDACRHFVWAIMLQKSVGAEQAEKILNAHENNPKTPENEKAMDLANNRQGLLTARKITSIESKTILDEFKNQLKDNKLIVLEPKYKSKAGIP